MEHRVRTASLTIGRSLRGALPPSRGRCAAPVGHERHSHHPSLQPLTCQCQTNRPLPSHRSTEAGDGELPNKKKGGWASQGARQLIPRLMRSWSHDLKRCMSHMTRHGRQSCHLTRDGKQLSRQRQHYEVAYPYHVIWTSSRNRSHLSEHE